MSIEQLYLTPFSLSVLNVALMLTLLILFLLRTPGKSPATRNLLLFLIGVAIVFYAFFHIFSSLDQRTVTMAWWVLHVVVFAIVFLMNFAYTYPRRHFETEGRRARTIFSVLSLAVYGGYLYHTTLIAPLYAPGGALFVFPGTPEVGILIGIMLGWTMAVLWRTARWLRSDETTDSQAIARYRSAIHKLLLVLISPVVLVTFIVLAYHDLVSWTLVGHLLGSGLMIFVFFFTVIYLNNAVEPTTLLVKVVGLSLGAVLIVLGFATTITMHIHQQAFLADKEAESARAIAQLAQPGSQTLPAELAYLAADGQVIYATRPHLSPLSGRVVGWENGWQFRELQANQPEQFYISHTLTIDGVHYEAAYSYLSYRHHVHTMAQPLAWLSLAAALFVLIIFPLFFRLSLFNPLRKLLDGVAAVEKGNLDIAIPVSVRDEIGRLTHTFNHMTGSVRDASERLRSAYDYQRDLTDAYSRFVPREILATLNKRTILELGLGDSVQKEMTILFSDIRAFTTLSERMTPNEVFSFINCYLERVGPVVRHHGGYIDKYIGDAVMALFPNSATHAVAAAIEMQRQVLQLNREQSAAAPSATIRIGIGIHTGQLMLGTIGERERMEGTVISDAVNLTARLEALTKLYDSPLLISASTCAQLPEDHPFTIRALDRVRVRGKSESIDILEVLDAEQGDRYQQKLATLADFEGGIAAYRAGDFATAWEIFARIDTTRWRDPAVEIYLQRCREFAQQAPVGDWDGAVSL